MTALALTLGLVALLIPVFVPWLERRRAARESTAWMRRGLRRRGRSG